MTLQKAEQLQSKLPKITVENYRTGKKELLDWNRNSFIHGDDENAVLKLSAEGEYSASDIADYYGEFRGGYPWINPVLEKWAEKHGMFWEWQNPGCIALYPE